MHMLTYIVCLIKVSKVLIINDIFYAQITKTLNNKSI